MAVRRRWLGHRTLEDLWTTSWLAIEAATTAMVALKAAISADLVLEESGIGSWNDQIGWRYSALIGDYPLSACSGMCASLADASLAIEKQAETEFSDNHWVRDGFARAATSGRGLAELTRGPKQRERLRLLELYRERSLGSLATTLDRERAQTRHGEASKLSRCWPSRPLALETAGPRDRWPSRPVAPRRRWCC